VVSLLIYKKVLLFFLKWIILGKTVIVNDKLQSLDNELWTVVNVPFNYYTSSEMLQSILEKPLERKTGRNYDSSGNKWLVYFIGK